MSRPGLIALLLVASACSQRSPWTTGPAPATAPSPRQAASDERADASGPRDGRSRSIALATAAPADATGVNVGSLYFPVAGLEGTRVADSFDDARDGGARRHNAIDIMAPRGTPVLSVQDGRILRLSTSSKGGITIYATDPQEQFVFYYAHLDRYHPGVKPGGPLVRGDTIGYVGTSGNAPDHVPHLHFQLMRMPANGRYWDGEPINPYPLLRATSSASGSPWR